jgi:hypothetical protein
MSKNAEALLHPDRLYSASEIASHPCPVPARSGLYAFYFDEPLPGIDIKQCHRVDKYAMLYVGIASKAPSANRSSAQQIKPKTATANTLLRKRRRLDAATHPGMSTKRATCDQASTGRQRA